MKTKMNIINLKKLTLTACAVLIITTAGFTQPKATGYEETDQTYQVRLEAFMNLTQQSTRYTAPATIETEDVSAEMERLDRLAAATEASLKYTAPVTDEITYDEYITENKTEIMLADQIK